MLTMPFIEQEQRPQVLEADTAPLFQDDVVIPVEATFSGSEGTEGTEGSEGQECSSTSSIESGKNSSSVID